MCDTIIYQTQSYVAQNWYQSMHLNTVSCDIDQKIVWVRSQNVFQRRKFAPVTHKFQHCKQSIILTPIMTIMHIIWNSITKPCNIAQTFIFFIESHSNDDVFQLFHVGILRNERFRCRINAQTQWNKKVLSGAVTIIGKRWSLGHGNGNQNNQA